MRMTDEIILVSLTAGTGSLSGPPVRTETTAYADVMSIGSAEFWRADASGKRMDIKFAINPDEYAGQMEVRYGGVTYGVVRTYLPPRGYQELYCARR